MERGKGMEERKLPNFLIAKLQQQYGKKLTEQIIPGYGQQRVTTFRVNTLKANCEVIEEELKKTNIQYEKVSWYDEAYIVKNVTEKQLQELDIYEQGNIYLQSLSSMLPPLILKPKPRSRYFRHGSSSTEEKQRSLQLFRTTRHILLLVK